MMFSLKRGLAGGNRCSASRFTLIELVRRGRMNIINLPTFGRILMTAIGAFYTEVVEELG